MLVDHINPINLPFFILWLDWCFYVHKHEFGILVAVAFWCCKCRREKVNNIKARHLPKDLLLSFVVGFIAWVAYCLYWQGVGVG